MSLNEFDKQYFMLRARQQLDFEVGSLITRRLSMTTAVVDKLAPLCRAHPE